MINRICLMMLLANVFLIIGCAEKQIIEEKSGNYEAKSRIIEDNQGIEITHLDMDLLIEEGDLKAQYQLLRDQERLKAKAEQLYLIRAIAEQAKQEGLDQDPIIQARLKKSLDKFYFYLKLNDLKQKDQGNLEAYARKKYTANKEDYMSQEKYNVAHILISTKNRPDQEALEIVNEVQKKLHNGDDFTALANEYSDDKSVKNNHGDLGKIYRGQMVKSFDDAAFSLQVGEISPPVKTLYGYHIIKLIKIYPVRQLSFEESRAAIMAQLGEEYWRSTRDMYYEKVKADNKMKVDDGVLKEYADEKIKIMDTMNQ